MNSLCGTDYISCLEDIYIFYVIIEQFFVLILYIFYFRLVVRSSVCTFLICIAVWHNK